VQPSFDTTKVTNASLLLCPCFAPAMYIYIWSLLANFTGIKF